MKTTKSKSPDATLGGIRCGGMLAILVWALAVGLPAGITNADFTFGTPTNLGSTINGQADDAHTSISTDDLSLYFSSDRPDGHGKKDIWIARRATTADGWGVPENLGPTVNGSANDADPGISADGLTLFFGSDREVGSGAYDLWMTTRATMDSEWSNPVNLGPIVNSSAGESSPRPSTDGLSLFFHSYRIGGQGNRDLWMTTRATKDDEWAAAVNLGPTVNSSDLEINPSISADGLCLFFSSNRPGGHSGMDLYVTMRPTINDSWGIPINLGAVINEGGAGAPYISSDGLTLHFTSSRAGGFGRGDLWQVSIEPVVDLNSDGIVDCADMCIMIDHWGTDEPLCDIGPMPWGDGIVDVQDLIVLVEYFTTGAITQ